MNKEQSGTLRDRASSGSRQALAHVRLPIYSRAYALILSSAATSVLGLVYWALAARLYSPHDLGINSALISTMMFLSYISQLSLAAALVRFIPTSGRATTRLILMAYGVGVGFAGVVAAVFLTGSSFWAPAVVSLLNSPGSALWFVVATMAWSLFALQDAVLTGLSRTIWVPVENFLFALSKIILLLALAGSVAAGGIYISWTIPAALTLIPINLMIFRRFLPAHMSAHGEREPEATPGLIARYLASENAGSLLVTAAIGLLPLIVLQTAGAQASAYYYIAWTISYSLQLFSVNIAISLSVEGPGHDSHVGQATRRMLRMIVGIQLPLAIGVATMAPIILMIFGGAYSDEGAMLLRFLALGLFPHGVNAVCIGLARVRRQFKVLFAIQAAQATLFVALAVVLLPWLGIAGVGLAFLGGQSTVALIAFTTQIRPLLRAPAAAPISTDDRTPPAPGGEADLEGGRASMEMS